MALLALVTAIACQDLTGAREIGKDDEEAATDSTLPLVEVTVPGADSSSGIATLQVGDSLLITASDSVGLTTIGAILVKDGIIVWKSDTISAKGAKSVSTKVALEGLSANFPFDSTLTAAGYAKNTRKQARYSGSSSTVANEATGPSVVVVKASQISLESGTFSDVAVDYAHRVLYYADPSENTIGYIDLVDFSVGQTSMTPGSRPTHVALINPGVFGKTELVAFSAGPRDYAVFNVATGPQGGTPLYRVDPPAADVYDLSSGTRSYIVRLPSSSVSGMFTSCPDGAVIFSQCILFAGMRGEGDASNSVLQLLDLSQANGSSSFDILTPPEVFPPPDQNNVLSGKDSALLLEAQVINPFSGSTSRVWSRYDRSRCASVYGDSIVSAVRPDSRGSIYVRTSSVCGVPLLKLDRTRPSDVAGTSYDMSLSAALNVVRDTRYQAINRINVSPAGTRVIVETPDKVLVSDADLKVRGELPPASSPTGSGVLVDPTQASGTGDGEWVAVAFESKVVIYNSNTFRPVASFSTAQPMTGQIEFFTLGSGASARVLLIGATSDRAHLLKIETSVADIKKGTGL